MITLHKLELFRAVYEHGSLNRAAQAHYMAQSVVSQHVQDLEAALGTKLFKRTPRGVRPTAAGDVLYEYASRILALVHEAERAVAQVSPLEGRTLTVAATPGVSVYLLPRWLNDFREEHPNIHVNLQTALTLELIREVQAGRYDLGFVEAEPEELQEFTVGFQVVAEVTYYVVVQPSHRWAGRDAIKLEELVQEPFITRQPGSRARKWLESTLGKAAARLKIVAELDSPGAIKFALLNGMGVAVLPDYVIEREVVRKELVRLRLQGFPLRRSLLMLWQGGQPFSLIQQAFVATLAAHLPGLRSMVDVSHAQATKNASS